MHVMTTMGIIMRRGKDVDVGGDVDVTTRRRSIITLLLNIKKKTIGQ